MKLLEKKNILVVDDELGYRDILSEEFAFAGAIVKTAGSGLEAIEVYRNFHDIELIVSDLNMPHGNGLFLLKEISEMSPQLPFILMVTGNEDQVIQQAKKMGAKGFFTKPIETDDLILAMKNLLAIQQADSTMKKRVS